jgi:hypothetical protein
MEKKQIGRHSVEFLAKKHCTFHPQNVPDDINFSRVVTECVLREEDMGAMGMENVCRRNPFNEVKSRLIQGQSQIIVIKKLRVDISP